MVLWLSKQHELSLSKVLGSNLSTEKRKDQKSKGEAVGEAPIFMKTPITSLIGLYVVFSKEDFKESNRRHPPQKMNNSNHKTE